MKNIKYLFLIEVINIFLKNGKWKEKWKDKKKKGTRTKEKTNRY